MSTSTGKILLVIEVYMIYYYIGNYCGLGIIELAGQRRLHRERLMDSQASLVPPNLVSQLELEQ